MAVRREDFPLPTAPVIAKTLPLRTFKVMSFNVLLKISWFQEDAASQIET